MKVSVCILEESNGSTREEGGQEGEEGGKGGITGAQPDRIFGHSSLYFGMKSGHALIVKGYFSTYENVDDNAKAPYVNFWTCVDFCAEKFWSGKV